MTSTPEALTVTNEQREQLTLDAIDAAAAIGLGEWSLDDAVALLGRDELLRGLLLYTQLIEVSISMVRGIPGQIEQVRDSARETARMWRTVPPEQAAP